ncbi:hypothetical protein KW794_00080 [Candidatus Saccharibacteria bacterium]|nr:hypothetical protein [Candidatus Saccharibacteria bacterium]
MGESLSYVPEQPKPQVRSEQEMFAARRDLLFLAVEYGAENDGIPPEVLAQLEKERHELEDEISEANSRFH